MTREFVTFIAAGAVAAAANWCSNLALRAVMPLEYSVAAAYLVGMTVAYALCRTYVFSASGARVYREYLRFAIVNVIALAQVWVVTIGAVEAVFPAIGWIWRPADVAHALGVASPVVTSYLAHRYYTFARRSAA